MAGRLNAPASQRTGNPAKGLLDRPGDGPALPPWVCELFAGTHGPTTKLLADGLSMTRCANDAWTLLSLRVPDAADLPAETLQKLTRDAYLRIFQQMETESCGAIVRMWNYIPDIRRMHEESLDQYMVFNAGRFEAFKSRWGREIIEGEHVPAASGVGNPGRDLIIDALAAARPGVPIENPRQVSAYHYSKRYGPLPPCFARATRLPADRGGVVFISGTASVVGEDSKHDENLAAQTEETLDNLAVLIRSALQPQEPAGHHSIELGAEERRRWLGCMPEIRVYYVEERDRSAIAAQIRDWFATDARWEWIHAPLCRAELLVEIEGTAEPMEHNDA